MIGRCRPYGDPRLLEVTEERNGPSGLRDDDDDDDVLLAPPIILLGQQLLPCPPRSRACGPHLPLNFKNPITAPDFIANLLSGVSAKEF